MKNIKILIIMLLINGSATCEMSTLVGGVKERKNIIVLLDLSDRVIDNDQIEKDKLAIKLIVDQFWNKIKLMPIARYDAIKIVVAPQNGITYYIEDLKGKITLDLISLDMKDKKPSKLKSLLYDDLINGVEELYVRAKMSTSSNDYKGAQLWRYMRDYFVDETFCDSGYSCKNYLIVLTDGYLDFEDYSDQRNERNKTTSTRFMQNNLTKMNAEWEQYYDEKSYGVLELGYRVNNLKVLVVGVHPKDQKYQFDMLKRVWADWMSDIGSESTKLILSDQVDGLGKELKRFFE